MDSRDWTRKEEWMDEARREPRWEEERTLIARWGAAEECLGKTRDVSAGGLGVVLRGAEARIGEPMTVDVVFGDEVVKFRGRVAHARAETWGCSAGIRCEGDDPSRSAFVRRRYASEDLPDA